MDIPKVLKELISIPSPLGEEKEIGEYLGAALNSLGLQVEFQEVLPQRSNVIGRRGKGKILLCTHMDTVPPYSHPHPYEPKLQGGKIYGRGAVDAKGQIAALLCALEKSRGDCLVAFTVDEENDAKGSEALQIEAEAAVVLEPTNLNLAICQAGAIEVEISTKGKATHSATSEFGENAILKALALLEKIKNLRFLQTSHQFFPAPWVNLGKIEGGVAPGVVPETCKMQLDIAILPNVDIKEALKDLEKLLEENEAQCQILDESPPFSLEPSEKVIRKLSQAYEKVTGEKPKLFGMPAWTDAENLMEKGIKSAVFGAGKLALAHSNCEYIDLKDLDTMSRILAQFIDAWE